jgi:hypothetical protein
MKRMLPLMCGIILGSAVMALAQGADEDGFEGIRRQNQAQFDRLNEGLRQAGKIFAGIGVVVAAIVVLKIISPGRIADGLDEWTLRRAVRNVDELLTRIQKEMETTTEDAKKEASEEGGVLAGMMEMAEFEQAEQVPSYVLTVNDLMLDNMRVTLKKLRRRTEGDAQRYRDYMFSVIKGIKTITEQSAEAGVDSGLAVDIRDYFKDEKRYRDWHNLLRRFAKRGKYQEPAQTFLVFMKALREGKPLAASAKKTSVPAPGETADSPDESSEIPRVLNEETLDAIQHAAAEEAESLLEQIRNPKSEARNSSCAWQFEFVNRQGQIHLREEAQRMLSIFLSSERKSLQEITKIQMLPCRAWEHVLHLLGVGSTAQLHRRVEDKLLTIQEIVVLEKAFLQTFAKRESLSRIYGQGSKAALMMDMHVPEMRREALAVLRRLHQVQLTQLDRATETLNEEETPRNGQIKKLIEHYVHHGHNPRDMEPKPDKEA